MLIKIIIFLVDNISSTVCSLGLILDIIGVVILFFYGLPSKFHTPPKLLLEQGLNKDELLENKKIQSRANRGLILIAIGFILQVVSQWLR